MATVGHLGFKEQDEARTVKHVVYGSVMHK